MPSDRSEPQRAPAWPDVPPAWPEMPPPASFTPSVRSYMEGTQEQAADTTATMGPLDGTAPRRPAPAFGGHDRTQAAPSHGDPASYGEPARVYGTPGPAGARPDDFHGATIPDGRGGPPGPPSPHMPNTPNPSNTRNAPGAPQRHPSAAPQGPGIPGTPDIPSSSPAPPAAGHRQQPSGTPFTPSVRSYAESAPPASTAPPPPPAQPEDPYRPFVTAGQISGPKTPPAHRQQELWNTVFGENYRAIDEYEDDEPGRPVWLYALVASVAAALVGVLVWAFAAGPLNSGDTAQAAAATAKPSPAKSPATAKPQAQTSRLPVYKGTPSPVNGVITDTAAGITLPRLGGPWRADADPAQIKAAYGFTSRQYVAAGLTTKGKREFAQVMSGTLAQSLAAKYTTPDKLAPVVSAVMFRARQTQFPKDNKVTKTAQQRLARNGLTGLLAAYKVTADGATTTVVVAAVNTGADLPTIVYMAVPALRDDLLPDINTVFRSIKPIR